jgi:very-short-patch-repair endonuclease
MRSGRRLSHLRRQLSRKSLTSLVTYRPQSYHNSRVMIHRHATKRKIRFARKLRRRQTRAERAFGKIARKLEKRYSIRFWRQVVLLGWIADFWCPKLKLVVEIDGPTHEERKEYDENRAQTVRFTNAEVLRSPAIVEYQMRELIKARRKVA